MSHFIGLDAYDILDLGECQSKSQLIGQAATNDTFRSARTCHIMFP